MYLCKSKVVKGRVGKEYQKARKEFLAAVEKKCAKCGLKALNLHVHHIQKRSTHPDLRCDKENMILLCAGCHRKEHDV